MNRLIAALRLAFSLTLIPRLFATLFLIPLVLSLIAVYGQLIATGVFVKTFSRDSESIETNFKQMKDQSLARKIIYGDGAQLPALKVCRWIEQAGQEVPPSPECAPDKLDVALQVSNPDNFDVSSYAPVFDGNIERLHICKTCHPDIVIAVGTEENQTSVYSVWGLMVLSLVEFNDAVSEQYIKAYKDFDKIKLRIGNISFHSAGLRNPVDVKTLKVSMAVVFNVSLLVVIAMWLALRAHRKVLDYFARSGALLPMVAATGHDVFYAAIWILTGLRVAGFLLAAVPMTIFGFKEILRADQIQTFLSSDLTAICLWIIAMVAGLGLATLISSIAELKQRHNFLSFIYRFLPASVCIIGLIVWSLTFLSSSGISGTIRNLMTAIPIVGIGPVLVAPVIKPHIDVLAIHTVLTALILLIALKHNARWFAAHLEDL